MDVVGDVLAFHKRFGVDVADAPSVPSLKVQVLRKALVREECEEFVRSMLRSDLVGVADGGIDLIYVVVGTLLAFGIDPEPIWHEVHRTNMAKIGGGQRTDGKILKPPDWRPPDVAGELERQKNVALMLPLLERLTLRRKVGG